MKTIKVILFSALTLLMAFSHSTNVCAKESSPSNNDILIEQGVTNEGIPYSIYETQSVTSGIYFPQIVNSISVSRYIIYESVSIIPPNQIAWTEVISGTTYRGTLYLDRYVTYSTYIKAYYNGTLVGVI